MIMMTHRDQKPIPTDPAVRQLRIRWLLEHPIWTHKITVMVPENIEDMFKPIEGTEFSEMLLPLPGWVEQEFSNGALQECWDLDLVFVNPETETIEDNEALNTAFRVWIESGPWYDFSKEGIPAPKGGWDSHNRWGKSHDTRLDTGGATMEEALLNLVALVECFYDDDGKSKDKWPCGDNEEECEPCEVEELCPSCGFVRQPD